MSDSLRRSGSMLVALVFATLPAIAAPGDRSADDRSADDRHADDRHGFRAPCSFGDAESFEDRFDDRSERIADLLDLSDSQRASVDRLRHDALDAARPKIERMRSAGRELHDLLESGSTDAQAVGSRMIELHQLRDELKVSREAVQEEIAKILTPEQRFALDALKEARRDFTERRFDGRFGHERRFDRGGDRNDDSRRSEP